MEHTDASFNLRGGGWIDTISVFNNSYHTLSHMILYYRQSKWDATILEHRYQSLTLAAHSVVLMFLLFTPLSVWARAVGGPDFSHLKGNFFGIRYPLRDEPKVKHDGPKFCNGQYWP